ncbi:MAG: nitrile hydratase subunit beta [Alphaproteobacteria bacterium]|nr:nitrile hydratase subunit beta [Alphaproteobacteria bacterium]
MRGGQDLGGMDGLGPIDPEPEAEEPIFHADWEKRVLAFTVATGPLGLWNIDMSRHARESQHPADYLRNSYYENWMAGLERLLVQTGVVTPEELAAGHSAGPAPDSLTAKRLTPEQVTPVLRKGGPADAPADAAPKFRAGDGVRVRLRHPSGHTRAPGYVLGRIGAIDRYHGDHIFPDRHAMGEKIGAPLYSVRFEAAALWGDDAVGRSAVYVDLWEPYLESVQ